MADRRTVKKAVAPARRAGRAVSAHEVQAAAEGVGEIIGGDQKITFMGEEYRLAESIGLMPLLKFANASARGIDSNDMAGLAALYAMIRDCIADDEWSRFEYDAIDKKAEGDDLMPVVQQAIEAISARPTSPPNGSSAGRLPTSPNSRGSSPSPGTAPLQALTPADSPPGR